MPRKNKKEIPRQIISVDKGCTFQIVEAYKSVRTNLIFTLADAQRKIILVSGAEPSSGKSSVCANLAITMAQAGLKTIILDADMRKPVQHRMFKISNGDGLSKILCGMATAESVIRRDVVPNLDAITCGPIPPNPSELLGTQRMADLLDRLSEEYSYIFLDSPPLNVVSDAIMLSDKAAGVLLVSRQRQTTYKEIQKAVDTLKSLSINTLGVVITDVDDDSKPYGRYGSYKTYKYEYKES